MKPSAKGSASQRREYVGMPEQRGTHIRGLKFKLLVFTLLCALPATGALSLWLTGITRIPLLAYLVVSGVAFGLYAYDKHQAKSGQWRAPEKVLHLAELLGGWPGALVAQQMLRHKTRKLSYQVGFWLIIALHQGVWIDVLFLKTTFLDL